MNRKQKIIVIASAIVLTVIVVAASVFAFSTENSHVETGISAQLIDSETGEYMLMNVPRNYRFNISLEDGQSVSADDFAVSEITGETASAIVDVSETSATVSAPEGGYKEGTLYVLDLAGKGSFTDKKYSRAQKILFCTERSRGNNIDYTDNVIPVEADRVIVEEGKITADGKYSEGDILLTDGNGDGIEEFYKLENAAVEDNETTADIGEPTAEEVYETIDVFYYEGINLEDIEVDEEGVIGNLEESGILDAFIDDAYALGVPNVDVVKEIGGKGGYKISIVIKDPEDERRQLQITLGVKDKVAVIVNDDVAMFDNTLTITDAVEISVKGQDKVQTEEKIREAIKAYTSDESIAGETETRVPLVPVKIPIFEVVVVNAELGLTAEAEYSAEFRAGVEAEVVLKQGLIYDFDKRKVSKLYGDTDGDINAYLMAQGTLNAFAGAYIKASLEVPLLIEVGLKATGGPYLDTEGSFIIDGIPNNISAEGYYRAEIGILLKADATVDVIFFGEHEYNLAQKKHPLWQVEKEPEIDLRQYLKKKVRYIGMTKEEITREMGELTYDRYYEELAADVFLMNNENVGIVFDYEFYPVSPGSETCGAVVSKFEDIFPVNKKITIEELSKELGISLLSSITEAGVYSDSNGKDIIIEKDLYWMTGYIDLGENVNYVINIRIDPEKKEIDSSNIVYICRDDDWSSGMTILKSIQPKELFGMTIDEVMNANDDAINHGASNGRNWIELKKRGIYTGHVYQGGSLLGWGDEIERGDCLAISGNFSSIYNYNEKSEYSEYRDRDCQMDIHVSELILHTTFKLYDDIAMHPEDRYYYDIFPQLYFEDSPHYGQTGDIYKAEAVDGPYGRKYDVYVVSQDYDGMIHGDSMCTVCLLPQQ